MIEFLVIKVLAKLFPRRYRVIPRIPDGAPLLRQFKIFNWLYLHSFVNREIAELFHLHRWRRMISIVLSGSFIEERYPGGYYKVHSAPSIYTMGDSDIHRIDYVVPKTWSLFFAFGRNDQPAARNSWGYYQRPDKDGDMVLWDVQIPPHLRVDSL